MSQSREHIYPPLLLFRIVEERAETGQAARCLVLSRLRPAHPLGTVLPPLPPLVDPCLTPLSDSFTYVLAPAGALAFLSVMFQGYDPFPVMRAFLSSHGNMFHISPVVSP